MSFSNSNFWKSLLIIAALVIGLSLIVSNVTRTRSQSLLIAAAASLQDAIEELDPVYKAAHPETTLNYNFAASGPLQQQIQQGAPVDIFISAAKTQMDALEADNLLLPDTRQNLLTNTLVLVVPSNATAGLTSFDQLTNSSIKRISVGEPRSVPAGRYAEEVFTNLGILSQLRSKLVYGNSVRSVLGVVESGNADAGVVYGSDAQISNRVRQVAVAPSALHSPIVYPIAIIRTSRNLQAARSYTQFLKSEAAQAIFKQYGFGIAP